MYMYEEVHWIRDSLGLEVARGLMRYLRELTWKIGSRICCLSYTISP
jgi:hypothetical protein